MSEVLIAQVGVGISAEQFMASELGRYLLGVAEQETERIAAELINNVEPTDTAKIMELQIEARVAERALKWIAEAVLTGQQAEYALHEEEAIGNDG